ncbi:hypothetical protein [Streptomyces sp. RK76]|uniref:hypothetical protein n=1 Tax=Streptomyces sp. RK76 TaxID=2824896 RepID=UPI001B374982|nr:hypothetical protein [Streptomyces sp. RK76]MBQ0954219.1 hypothetical protein [Streptomyces sp. RK76]
MAMTGTARVWISVTAVLTGLATVGLVLVAVFADPDSTGRTVGLVGAVVTMASLLVSVIALFRTTGGGSAASGRRVRGGRRSVVAGGNITGTAIGDNSKVTGPHAAPRSTASRRNADDVRAGRDGIAAGGDITDSALGDGSER